MANAGEGNAVSLVNARELLRDSLAEAQATVRAYDTKAQIVGVGYIFSLAIVGKLDELLPAAEKLELEGLFIAWFIVIVPILLFGHVLYPTRKTAPRIEATERDGIQHVLYIDPDKKTSVQEVREASLAAEPINELSFELLMVSKLRETKRHRFLRALYVTAFSFLCFFAFQILRILR